MDIKLIRIVLATISFSLLSTGLLGELTVAEIDENELHKKDRVSFYCKQITDKDSGGNIPATVAYVPQRQVIVSIIAWKVNYGSGWDTQTRCDTVSPKFQTFHEDGRLNYLTNGINQGYSIICAVLEKGQACEPENQLFQVKPGSDPKEVLISLNRILSGESSETVVYDSSQTVTTILASPITAINQSPSSIGDSVERSTTTVNRINVNEPDINQQKPSDPNQNDQEQVHVSNKPEPDINQQEPLDPNQTDQKRIYVSIEDLFNGLPSVE